MRQRITLSGPVSVDRLTDGDFDMVTLTSGGITVDIPPSLSRTVAAAIVEAGAPTVAE